MVSSVSSFFYCRSCGAEGIYYAACNVTGLSFWVSSAAGFIEHDKFKVVSEVVVLL
jgi:hypothetical protein